jgi:hypothetical protein
MPLHLAATHGAGLEVVKALLEAHPEAAQEANEVRGGAAWETVGLWMCLSERERVSACVDWYTRICTHIGFMVCGCVLVHAYAYESKCVWESVLVYLCVCVCLQTQRLHNVGAASCVLPVCMLCKRQAAACLSHAHA